jgi:glycosyltransferase involved in cell wall biosynthesis
MDNKEDDNRPTISVVIPMKNEEKHITRCLESVVDQDYPKELIEVMVVDGGSDDNSLGIVKRFVERHPNVKLMGGAGVNCPAAMNIGIRSARGKLVSKIDAHGYVASDFLRMGEKYLYSEKDIKCVGGPISPVAQTIIAGANALARSSRFGVGKGIYSIGGEANFVDTVQCGMYEKNIFTQVGLFDEELQFGEDEEINWRIREKGYKIFSTPEIRFFYYPRDSFRKLFKQYYNYGLARVRVIQKHPNFLRIKHVIPTMFVLALLLSGILGAFSELFLWVLMAITAAYLTMSLFSSVLISAKEGFKYLGLLPVSFAALHFGYGMGFGYGLIRMWAEKVSGG